MTPDDEDFLRALYQSMDQMVLAPEDYRVVDFQAYGDAVGPDVISELAREMSWSTDGSAFFLSGFRGSGKSTELLRLGKSMRERGYVALRLEAEDYLNLRAPVDVIEFLFFLVGGISDAIDAVGLLPSQSGRERGWERLRHWLSGLRRISITPDAEASVGFAIPGLVDAKVNFKAELRSDESFVAELRTFLEGRLSELVLEANRIVADLVAEVRANWMNLTGTEWRGLVVMVDSLDHVRGVDFAEVRRALVDLVDKQSATITLSSCRTIFVVPPWVSVDFTTARKITNVKVTKRDGGPNPDGVSALREVVRLRTPNGDVERAFGADDVIDGLIADSGGHLRDLLRLIKNVAVSTNALPFTASAIARGRQTVRDGLVPIADDDAECLRHVASKHVLPLPSDAAWESLARLFDRHLVLGYKNGETWYDVHPLIADLVN